MYNEALQRAKESVDAFCNFHFAFPQGAGMDIAQLEQMVTWLDQQRRRADQDMRQLEQRLAGQMGMIEEQARRIQQLESELAAARAQLAEQAALQKALDNLRNEVRSMIERLEEERLARERDQERLRAAEREKWGRDLAEVRKRFDALAGLQEDLEMRKVEERRLGEAILQLRETLSEVDRRSEEALRNVSLLIEQRTQDHKRIGQLQGETVELFRRLETTVNKLTLLEERIQRQESAVKHVAEITEEMRKAEEAFLEDMRRAEVDRERQITVWKEGFEEMQARLAEAMQEFDRFQVQYEKSVQAVSAIERFQAELRQQVQEIREAQRVAEDRMRRQMRDFESEQEKRWKKQLLEWEYKFQEEHRQIAALDALLQATRRQLQLHEELLDILWRLQQEWGSHQLGAAQGLLQLIEEMAAKRERALKEHSKTPPPEAQREESVPPVKPVS